MTRSRQKEAPAAEPAQSTFPGYGSAGIMGAANPYDRAVAEALVEKGLARAPRNKTVTWTAELEYALLEFKQQHGIREGGVGPRTWDALMGDSDGETPAGDEQPEQQPTEPVLGVVEPAAPGADPTLPDEPMIEVGENESDTDADAS